MAANLPFAGCKPLFAGAVTFSKTRASQSKTLIWIGFYALRSAARWPFDKLRAVRRRISIYPYPGLEAVASYQLPVARKNSSEEQLPAPVAGCQKKQL